MDKLAPANQDERIRVQDIAGTEWRLLRIPSPEASILALGRVKLAPLVAQEANQQAREQMLEAEVLLTDHKVRRQIGEIKGGITRKPRANPSSQAVRSRSAPLLYLLQIATLTACESSQRQA